MWTLPNLLTLARIVAIVPLVAFIEAGWWVAAFALFVAAAVTDWLDGFLARRWNQQSDLGRMLDPIADKLIVAAVLVALMTGSLEIYYSPDHFGFAPNIWVVSAIICREILVSGVREYMGLSAKTLPVSSLAKWKTASQLMALGLLILANTLATGLYGCDDFAIPAGRAGTVLLLVSALLAWITALAYLRAGLRHMEPPR